MDELTLISQLEAIRLTLSLSKSALDMLAALGNESWYEEGALNAFLYPTQSIRRAA